MRKAFLIVMILCANALAQVTKTNVYDILVDPFGVPLKGTVTFTLNTPYTGGVTSPSGLMPRDTSVTVSLNSSGRYDIALWPSASLSPECYYEAHYQAPFSTARKRLGMYSIPVVVGSTPRPIAPYLVTATDKNARFRFASELTVQTLVDAVVGGVAGVGSFNGRTGVVLPASNDYTWAQINKTTSSLADITTRSASDLSSGTLPDARFPATLPALNGVNLTALNASNLSSGTLPDARFPATLPAASGVNLTALNASNLSSGTVPDARFPATLPALNGVNLTALNASNLSSGTLPDARFPATLPAASGANLTTLNASNLSSGTLPNARLSAVPNSALATMATSTIKGNNGSGTADLTVSQTRALLGLSTTDTVQHGQLSIIKEWPGSANPAQVIAEFNSYTDSNRFVFRHAGGTIASPTQTLANTVIFNLQARGMDDVGAFSTSAKVAINAVAAQDFTSANQGTYVTFITTPLNSASQAERVRIDPSGLLGVGTASPTGRMHALAGTTTEVGIIGQCASGASSSQIVFSVRDGSATEQMNVKCGGALAATAVNTGSIGTTAGVPQLIINSNQLDQRSSTNAQAYKLYNTYTSGSNYERLGIQASSNAFLITQEATGAGSVRELVVGATGAPVRLRTSLATPSSPSLGDGDWWVDCSGTSPSRVCAIKVRDGGATRTIASMTY